jgi:hypothetical protein
MNNTLEEMWKSRPDLRYCPRICLDSLRKTKKNIRFELLEYEAGMVTTGPQRFI